MTTTHAHAENYSARTHPEFVVLDIGGTRGALIVHAEADMHAREIEISRAGDDGDRSHKEVLERNINGHPAFTAVFDGIEDGLYTLWLDGEPREREVRIVGGAVAELDWRGAAA